jgi:hypothetical protein
MRDQRYATFGAARRAPASSLPDRPIGSHLLDPRVPIPANAKPIRVDVSLDWKRLFIEPDQGVVAVNELVAPAPELFNAMNTTVPAMWTGRGPSRTSAKTRKASGRGGAVAGEFHAGDVRDALA